MEDRVRDSAIALTDNEVQALANLRGLHLPPGASGAVEIVRAGGYSIRVVGDAATMQQAFRLAMDAEAMNHDRKMSQLTHQARSSESQQVSSDLGRCVIAIPLFLILGAALWMLWASFSNSGKYNPRYGALPDAIHYQG
jgi:hypothetical protein